MREFQLALAHDPHLRHSQISYGAHPEQVAEIVLPEQADALILVIHGGFWRAMYDRGHTAAQCAALARSGYAVASLEYRRVGNGGGWPTTFEDVASAVDSVPALLASEIGVLPVVLMGHSAGGHLALWATARHRLLPGSPGHRTDPPNLAGAVALGAAADLGWLDRSGAGAGAARDLLGCAPDDDPQRRWAAADPARLVPTGIRTVLVHGAHDDAVPLECARSFFKAARDVGDPCKIRVLPNAGHFEFLDPNTKAWSEALAAAMTVLVGPAE